MAKKKRSVGKKRKSHDIFESLPDRRAMEQIMRQIAAGLGDERPEETPLDRAHDLMYQAFESGPAEQARLARRALELSPDCADAHVLLAEHAKSADEALTHLRRGVEAGERAIGTDAFKEYEGHFWGFVETRPYMRAREGLAQCLWETGQREEAAEHYREMLRLNPGDNQGVRYSLATLLLDLDRDDELRQLLLQYEKDASAEWVYTTALVAFREGSDSPQTNRLLTKAAKINKHVAAYLLGNKQLPQGLPPYISLGGDDEAASYAIGNRRAWLNTPGAVSWLRKTIKTPLPRAPKHRRPSWPQLRLTLRGCPQEPCEIWQVDTMPYLPDGQSEPDEDSPWLMAIVNNASHEVLGFEVLESQPKPANMWDFLTEVMRKPHDAEPRRPGGIEVRQEVFCTAWKAKLGQIGVECILCERLDAIDAVRERLPAIDAEGNAAAFDTTVRPEDLLSIPSEPGEVWQANLRAMPIWITGEGEPYRPWVGLIVSRTDDLVLGHQTSPSRPPADWLWGSVVQAIRRPAVGEPHRPSAIEVDSAKQREALLPYLERAGIECVVVPKLETLDAAYESLANHAAAQGEPPAILNSPGMTPAQAGSFYAAAAEYYRQKPWQRVLGDTIIKIECDKFQSGPWYAVVMGQSGVQQGLAIYEDLAALQGMIDGNASEEENARGMSAISMMFSEAFEISFRDLDAAEKHGWSVASPEAYPLVIRVNPGCAVRPPLVWELELLEGCLRTIPDFVTAKADSLLKVVTTTSGALSLRISWVPDTAP